MNLIWPMNVHSHKFHCIVLHGLVMTVLLASCESYDYDKKYSKSPSPQESVNKSRSTIQFSTNDLSQTAKSVVQIFAGFQNESIGSSGSGSVVDEYHVLTNYHVVNHEDRISDVIQIWFTNSDLSKPPSQYVSGSVEFVDKTADLALIKTHEKIYQHPVSFLQGAMPDIGSQITVIGFPSLGSSTITLTSGIVSGYMTLNGVDMIKTDSELNKGNSGGVAVNSNNQIVGVPTAVNIDAETGGRLGLIVPNKYCQRIIRKSYQ